MNLVKIYKLKLWVSNIYIYSHMYTYFKIIAKNEHQTKSNEI